MQPTGVGYYFLQQEIFTTQGSKLHLLGPLHWQANCLPLHHLGSPQYNVRICKLLNTLTDKR